MENDFCVHKMNGLKNGEYVLVMIFMFFMMITFIMRIFFFLVFRFPGFDDDFFFFSSEIYRLPDSERIIEFFDIVTSDVFFASSGEVSLHDV